MVYTTLLELYRIPTVIPIEVTILRGVRRLRLSSSLRTYYSDFVPKIWHILAKLGYQKYLQKIYISMEYDSKLRSPFYQLPIVIALLEALGMLTLQRNVHVSGRFQADYSLHFPIDSCNVRELPTSIANLLQTKSSQGVSFTTFLNEIHTKTIDFPGIPYNKEFHFPGVVFTYNAIDFVKTPLSIIRLIPIETFQEMPVYISIKKHLLDKLKIDYLQRIKPKVIRLQRASCLCNTIPCTCTSTEIETLNEQQNLISELVK